MSDGLPQTVTAELTYVSPEYAGQLIARIEQLRSQRAELLAALSEIARLRLATNEGSLRVRADRIWDLASKAIAEAERNL